MTADFPVDRTCRRRPGRRERVPAPRSHWRDSRPRREPAGRRRPTESTAAIGDDLGAVLPIGLVKKSSRNARAGLEPNAATEFASPGTRPARAPPGAHRESFLSQPRQPWAHRMTLPRGPRLGQKSRRPASGRREVFESFARSICNGRKLPLIAVRTSLRLHLLRYSS